MNGTMMFKWCVVIVMGWGSVGLAQEDRIMAQPRVFYVDGCCGCVDNDGLAPDRPLASIQTAIDRSWFRDQVLVYAGMYHESLDLKGKAITIKGIAGPLGLPILVATGPSAVSMLSGEGEQTVLQNLIIQESVVGISLVDSNPTLQNLTVVKCGIGVLGLGQSDPAINSCIFWSNASEDLAGVSAKYSCIEKLDEAQQLYNLSLNPEFVNAKENDYRLKSMEGRYTLLMDAWVRDEVSSPCISAGDPGFEYSLEPQPNGARINMGAFGNTIQASTGPDWSVDVRIVGWNAEVRITEWSTGDATANVSNNGREIVRVEFYCAGKLVAQAQEGSTRDGWSAEWPWDLALAHKKKFELIVVAVDEYGNRSLSEPKIVQVNQSGGR